jgi:hypothetical protein
MESLYWTSLLVRIGQFVLPLSAAHIATHRQLLSSSYYLALGPPLPELPLYTTSLEFPAVGYSRSRRPQQEPVHFPIICSNASFSNPATKAWSLLPPLLFSLASTRYPCSLPPPNSHITHLLPAQISPICLPVELLLLHDPRAHDHTGYHSLASADPRLEEAFADDHRP